VMMRLYDRIILQGHSAILPIHALRATHICQRFRLPGLRRGLGKRPVRQTPRPQIWFNPLPPLPTHLNRPFIGSEDFIDLFSENAPWEQAANRVHVFEFFGGRKLTSAKQTWRGSGCFGPT